VVQIAGVNGRAGEVRPDALQLHFNPLEGNIVLSFLGLHGGGQPKNTEGNEGQAAKKSGFHFQFHRMGPIHRALSFFKIRTNHGFFLVLRLPPTLC
jgi:hypothetical protein